MFSPEMKIIYSLFRITNINTFIVQWLRHSKSAKKLREKNENYNVPEHSS